MAGFNLNNVAREERKEFAERVVRVAKSQTKFEKIKYFRESRQAKNTDNLERRDEIESKHLKELAELYEKLEPRWKANFNAAEQARTDKKYTSRQIEKDDSLMDVLGGVIGADSDNASLLAMNMYMANKIAHSCETARDRLVENYIFNKNGKYFQSEDNVKNTSKNLKFYFEAVMNGDRESERKYERALKKYNGIEAKDISNLEKMGFKDVLKLELDMFAVKDLEMLNLIQRLQERDEQAKTEENEDPQMSYGMISNQKVSRKGEVYYERIMAVDLPFYGQFSVHMRDADTISALSSTPYHKHLYSLESAMLTEEVSAEAKEDLRKVRTSKGKTSIKDVAKEKTRDREESKKYAHYLTLKNGGSKKELDDIYDER